MTEVRLTIEDAFLDDLRADLRSPSAKTSDLVRDALTLYGWAARERASGRAILSAADDLSNMTRLAMPALEKAAEPFRLRRQREERAVAEAAAAATAGTVAAE